MSSRLKEGNSQGGELQWKCGTVSQPGRFDSDSFRMVIAVIGSRYFDAAWEYEFDDGDHSDAQAIAFMYERLESVLPGHTVISGGAGGPDSWGIDIAKDLGCSTTVYKAIWKKPNGDVDRGAGFRRNTVLAEQADWVIAFWDGESRGTLDTITKAHNLGKRVTVYWASGRCRENEKGACQSTSA